MYRTAVSTVFFSALAIIAADLLFRLIRRPDRNPSPEGAASPFRWLRVLGNAVGLLSLAAVAISGFSTLWTPDNVMTGNRLIWHVTFAPAFAVSAVVITLFWADKNRLDGTGRGHPISAGGWAVPLRKLFFWSAVAFTVPTILSILAAMFPLFGSEEQQDLFRIHRYGALLLAASGLLFVYFALVTWRARSED